jgi:hypothetical protein
MGRYLKSQGVERFRMSTPGREYAYQFPKLSECRARFSQEFAIPPEWDELEDWISHDPVDGIVPLRRAV